jgi:beta-hydroxylase
VDGEHGRRAQQVFGGIYEVHLAGQRVKKWNRKVYYALRYSLTLAVLGLIIASALP